VAPSAFHTDTWPPPTSQLNDELSAACLLLLHHPTRARLCAGIQGLIDSRGGFAKALRVFGVEFPLGEPMEIGGDQMLTCWTLSKHIVADPRALETPDPWNSEEDSEIRWLRRHSSAQSPSEQAQRKRRRPISF